MAKRKASKKKVVKRTAKSAVKTKRAVRRTKKVAVKKSAPKKKVSLFDQFMNLFK